MTEELAVQDNFPTDTWLQYVAADTALVAFGCATITSIVTDYWFLTLLPMHMPSSREGANEHWVPLS